MNRPSNPLEPGTGEWPEALATVLTCKYEFGAGRALAFGIPTTRHFRITYNYFADGELHTGELTAAKPLPQGSLFPIRYNPEAPRQHTQKDATTSPASRGPVFLVGILGSVILSLAWFALLRGCH